MDEDDDDTVAAEVPPEPCEVEVDLEVDLEEETFRPIRWAFSGSPAGHPFWGAVV